MGLGFNLFFAMQIVFILMLFSCLLLICLRLREAITVLKEIRDKR